MSKAVLFDLDGTLIDSSEGITKSVQYALAHFGIEEASLEKLRVFIGPPLDPTFTKYYGFSVEQAKEAVRVYRERYRPIGIYECQLYPHVKETIQTLKQQGYTIGIASSKPEVFCRKILEHLEVLDLLDDVVGSVPEINMVTKEQVLHEVMRRWSAIEKKDMCLVGDTIFDIEGANLVGIDAIGVSYGFGDVKEMLEGGAKAIIDSLDQLPQAIKTLFTQK